MRHGTQLERYPPWWTGSPAGVSGDGQGDIPKIVNEELMFGGAFAKRRGLGNWYRDVQPVKPVENFTNIPKT